MARVLIVDDEPRIRDLIREHLQYAGFTCAEAGDGTQALAELANGGIDLVILDIMMPFMDGMTCLREMRTRKIMTPVIMLTARSEEYDKLAGLEGGADDYVVKPFSPRELVARVKAVLARTMPAPVAEGNVYTFGNLVIDNDDSRQEVVSNVSHELKTPITSIKVLADSLNTQQDVPNELYKEFMHDIVEEIDRESQIINDLLSLVRMDKTAAGLNLAPQNINELVEHVLRRLKPIAEEKNIELVLESFRPVVAEIDEVKITQVVTNLVENGIKYNVANGWVRVSVNADHKFFYLTVADSGIGIPDNCRDKIFERFYRVDKARSRQTGGTGLGLAITKTVVLMHKGAIRVYSKEGEGSTFTVRIPLTQAKKS